VVVVISIASKIPLMPPTLPLNTFFPSSHPSKEMICIYACTGSGRGGFGGGSDPVLILVLSLGPFARCGRRLWNRNY
jgi:hypothetical protein